jgi:hypothetical protein
MRPVSACKEEYVRQGYQSEVAQLRAQIEQEHQAMVWALQGLSSGCAQHAFISRRMGHAQISYEGMVAIVGHEEAMRQVCSIFEKSPPQTLQRAMVEEYG